MREVTVRILSSISSAVAVHTTGAQSLFQCSTNDSIALLSTFTELNVRSYSAGHRGVSGCWGFWDGCGVSA